MELKAYQSQIKELIPLRNEPDFNELINKILFGENNSDKFLIKMELNRLSKPCQRILDIRDKVTEECMLFEESDIKHYLTQPTIKVLQQNIALYGLYTVGAYEAVHEYIADQKNKLNIQNSLEKPAIVKKEQCELISFSQKNKRGAPRMFFVPEITLTFDETQTVIAHTSNISLTGIKVKIKDKIFITDQTMLSITFTGLKLEYHDKVLSEALSYQLVKQETDDEGYHYLYLNYKDNNPRFTAFISEFIRLNQYKYKIDVHYYYQLAKISALKHAYLDKMNTLPIYLDCNAPTPFLFSLKNSCNQQLINQWSCEGVDQLSIFFSELRLVKLLAQLKNKNNTTIYTFTHTVNDKHYFLSASEEELLDKGLKQTFINYGRSNFNWRVYHLSLTPCQYQASNRYEVTEPTPPIFKHVTHIATLQQLIKAYPFSIDKELAKEEVNQLNQFVHRPQGSTKPARKFTLFSNELRKEERYLYSSHLAVSDKNSHYDGQLIDFSSSGLKIKLEQITSFTAGSHIVVNLAELQKISKKYPLSDLHYKVVKTGANNVLHLQAANQKTLTICKQFFPALVKNNAKHFTCIPLKERQQPINKHLVEIAEESFKDMVLFISSVASRPKISFAAIDVQGHPLHTLFSLNSDTPNELNYYPIANNQLYERLVVQSFKNGTDLIAPKEALIYVKAFKDTDLRWHITSFLDEDFQTEQDKAQFIKECQFNATFYALHYRLTALPEIDLQSIKPEIRAISRFATHLTKKLEEELHAVNAVIEITDRTSDIITMIENRTN